MSETFDYTDFEKFAKEIERWPILALDAAEEAMNQSVIYLHGKIPEYPLPPMGGVGFATAAQRAWFFASVKDGKVPGWRWVDGHPQKVGSTRTGTLGRKFTESVDRSQWEVIGEIGTNVPYAPWVVGPSFPGHEFDGRVMYQARIHADRWWQFENVMSENVDGAWQEFTDTFWPKFLELIDTHKGG